MYVCDDTQVKRKWPKWNCIHKTEDELCSNPTGTCTYQGVERRLRAEMKLTKEDLLNITGWITAASMMIEAKLRVPWRESEVTTFKKLDQLKREAGE